jgi:phosphatidate cytidylyltransferase
MSAAHWSVLLVYAAFTLAATLLALVRRWLRPNTGGESVWRKYPGYILINLFFMAASWLPAGWHILTALLAALGGLAAWEMVRALSSTTAAVPEKDEKLSGALLPFFTAFLIAAADLLEPALWIRAWLFVFLSFVIVHSLSGQPERYPRRALALAGCLVYLPVCLAAYVRVRQADPAGFQVVFLYLCVATNDALAQVTGQLLGRRSLAPSISPAKTVEGAIGGLLFAGAMGLALSSVLGWNAVHGAIMGLALGLAGLAGDLTASSWKRALGLKNFSALLGAQGGVLDRFDGLILAAPVFTLLMVWH